MPDPVVTLQEVKDHLHVDSYDEDTLIMDMMATAEEACRAYAGIDIDEVAPAALASAIKIHVAALYEGRDSGGLPDDAMELLRDYKEWVFA